MALRNLHERRLHVIAAAAADEFAAKEHLAVALGRFHVLAETHGGLRGIERAHEYVAPLGIADLELLREPREPRDELVANRSLDVHHRAGTALLSLQAEGRTRHALRRNVEVRRGRHVGGVLAAHFSDDEFRGRGAGQGANISIPA